MVILIPNAWNGPRVTGYKPIPIDSLLAIEIRRRAAGGPRSASTTTEWRTLSQEEVRRAYGGCRAW
jgi:hypothetical protein